MNVYKASYGKLTSHLVKRILLLLAKLMGFKAFCLFLATALLSKGYIENQDWLTVIITVICSASGIHIADSLGLPQNQMHTGGTYDKKHKNDSAVLRRSDGTFYCTPSGRDKTRERIGEICRRAAAQLDGTGE